MGDLSKRKQEKNTDDCWDSISIVSIGNATGSSGPWIFLASDKRMTVKPLQNNGLRLVLPMNGDSLQVNSFGRKVHSSIMTVYTISITMLNSQFPDLQSTLDVCILPNVLVVYTWSTYHHVLIGFRCWGTYIKFWI